MQPHPEGGFYREIHRSNQMVRSSEGKTRPALTLIYYLLSKHDRSHLHRIAQEEAWHFLDGDPLEVVTLADDKLTSHYLGRSNEGPQMNLQLVIPPRVWFGARVSANHRTEMGFSLAGCTVAPGFDFADFEMATPDLIHDNPQIYGLSGWIAD